MVRFWKVAVVSVCWSELKRGGSVRLEVRFVGGCRPDLGGFGVNHWGAAEVQVAGLL